MLKAHTPCDERDPFTGSFTCPYIDMDGYVDCQFWCQDIPEPDYPEIDAEELEEFMSFADFGEEGSAC